MRLDQVLQAGLRRLRAGARPEMAAPPPPPMTDTQKQFFEDNGYLILPGLFKQDYVERVKSHLDVLWQRRHELADVAIDSMAFGKRFYFRKADPDIRNYPYKLLDLHLEDEMIRDTAAFLPLIHAVRDLLGATPLVCNTLLFEHGSQQEPHFDTFFMPSKTKNMMAASWIALDRVTETNGPLYYYPKSHLIEPFRFSNGRISAVFAELKTDAARHIETIIAEYGLKQEKFLPEPGDVLIWHAQLLHGGSQIINPSESRRSLVTHYWTEIDYPDAEQRLDLGDGRWILRKPHQPVIDEDTFARADTLIAALDVPDDMRAAVPAAFDARGYLVRNQDVLRAGVNPWEHYINHGRAEGRTW